MSSIIDELQEVGPQENDPASDVLEQLKKIKLEELKNELTGEDREIADLIEKLAMKIHHSIMSDEPNELFELSNDLANSLRKFSPHAAETFMASLQAEAMVALSGKRPAIPQIVATVGSIMICQKVEKSVDYDLSFLNSNKSEEENGKTV